MRTWTSKRAFGLALLLTALFAGSARAHPILHPIAHTAAVCADYSNQAAAQRAHDSRDPDHDGVYCVISPR